MSHPTEYTLSTDHAASSHGIPVFVRDGQAFGPAEVGIEALPANCCGRVDFGDQLFWSGYGTQPDRMMAAVAKAYAAGARTATVHDFGKVVCS